MPQPAHKPTEADHSKVRILVSMGLTHKQIAEVMQISHVTLKKYYDTDLKHGATLLNAAIAGNIARQAMKDDFRSYSFASFWAKARMGWQDRSSVELTGPNGGAVIIYDDMPAKDPNL